MKARARVSEKTTPVVNLRRDANVMAITAAPYIMQSVQLTDYTAVIMPH